MLCSVVAEFTQQMQHNLLGVVFSGHNLVSSSGGWENIFTNPADSILYHLSQLLSLLESLRSKWPIISSSTPHQFLIRPVFTLFLGPLSIIHSSNYFLVPFQIYLVKSQLEAVYSLPIQWSSPEVWECWTTLHEIGNQGIEYFFLCANSGKENHFVMEIFCILIVQFRWSYEKLREIQANDISSM